MSLSPTHSTLSFASQRGLAADSTSLNNLNSLAGRDSKAAIKETAKQFEALFMKELLKSMRDASMKSGLMDNEASNLGTELLDHQFATQMTGIPGGLSQMIERQLSQQIGAAGSGGDTKMGGKAAALDNAAPAVATKASPRQTQFVSQHKGAAEQVSRETGIPASYMMGQAAHETGWGRSEIKNADGSTSFNLFGIKAGAGWKGKVAEVTTTEYINGQARKVTAKFRAYDSYADSFRDYAKLIGNTPRYEKVMNNLHSAQAFASGLQKAGYATDPQYASKLSRVINTALNVQRALA
jgi:peptidoglycan hydrolase FlgJ